MTAVYMLTVVVRAYFPKTLTVDGNDDGHGLAGASGTSGGTDGTSRADAAGRTGASGTGHGGASVSDPGWKMKLPLIVFASAIILLGLCSRPLVHYFELLAGGMIK